MKKSTLPCLDFTPLVISKTTLYYGNPYVKNRTHSFSKHLLWTCYIFLFFSGLSLVSSAQGFRVSGNQLLDANGNNFVMKGFNVPTAWFINDVNSNIANMRNRTGANCLRIVVSTSTPDAAWQASVNNCIANRMIPMVELHSVTGNNSPSELNRMAQWWASKASFLTRPEIARYILINIANEWGDWFMSATATGTVSRVTWRDAYITAVRTIRNAGIRTTLVIDAAGYGQDNRTQTLLEYAKAVQASDTYHNCLFSLHMYCEWKVNGNSPISLLPGVKNAGIPVIVGEFGFQHSEGGGICDVNEGQVISTANANGIGWLAWSWKGNGGGVEYLDLSNDWGGTSLTAWGNTVVNGSGGTRTATTASVFSSTPTDPGGSIANGTYRITARNSGKSLDVSGRSTADGADVVQWTYGGGTNQQWSVQSLGGGAYSIRAVHSGKSLDLSGFSTADGGDINQWTYAGGNNQRWRIESVGSGYFRIVSVHSGKAVEITGNSTTDGAGINQRTYSGATNQQFTFQLLSSSASIAAPRVQVTEEAEMRSLVYPNPSRDRFNISQNGSFTYIIRDINGKVVERGRATNKTGFGQKLAKGLYLVQVESRNSTKTMKVVKQ